MVRIRLKMRLIDAVFVYLLQAFKSCFGAIQEISDGKGVLKDLILQAQRQRLKSMHKGSLNPPKTLQIYQKMVAGPKRNPLSAKQQPQEAQLPSSRTFYLVGDKQENSLFISQLLANN